MATMLVSRAVTVTDATYLWITAAAQVAGCLICRGMKGSQVAGVVLESHIGPDTGVVDAVGRDRDRAYAASRETWRGRDAASGATRMVTVVGLDASDPAAADRAHTAAEPLLAFRDEHAAALLGIEVERERLAVVRAEVVGLPLTRLLASRGPLAPGEVVTLGLPLARTLAAAHGRGIVHGDLRPASVVVTPDGRPVVVDLGLAALTGVASAPADDVLALALLLDACIDAAAAETPAVRTVLAPALSGHPAARPGAADLAIGLAAACVPTPLRRPAPADPPAAPVVAVADRSPSRRRVRAAVGAGLALVVLGVVVPLVRSPAPPAAGRVQGALPAASPAVSAGSSRAPQPAGVAEDWQHVLAALDTARFAAFTEGDLARLGGADAPGSAAEAVDRGRVRDYLRAGARVRGAAAQRQILTVLHAGPSVAELLVRERLGAFDVVNPSGAVLEHRTSGPSRRWRVTLLRVGAGWRTAQVSPA
jgi:hypothetical protein